MIARIIVIAALLILLFAMLFFVPKIYGQCKSVSTVADALTGIASDFYDLREPLYDKMTYKERVLSLRLFDRIIIQANKLYSLSIVMSSHNNGDCDSLWLSQARNDLEEIRKTTSKLIKEEGKHKK
jgi:hypothetical protein